jgi:hypothetical protein
MKSAYYAHLSPRDRARQIAMIHKSQRLYRRGEYFTRKPLAYPQKRSAHVARAQKLYGTPIVPSATLAQRTGCSVAALRAIVRKGEGAYYSSGSRPSQTPQSWAYARLASAISGGKAARVDYHIVKTCDPSKPAYQLATKRRRRR